MDSTTKMIVKDILKDGYYRKDQTLDNGGWAYLITDGGIADWNHYVILFEDGSEQEIVARDEKSAMDAFTSLFDLSCEHDVYEKTVTYKRIT